MGCSDTGNGRVCERLEGPVCFFVGFLGGGVVRPRCAFGNPCAYFFDIVRWHSIAFGRHPFIGIAGHQESQEWAVVGFSGDDVGRVEITTGEGGLCSVESVARFLLFWAVAFDAMLCEKGFDFGLKIDGERAGDEEDSRDERGV